MNIPNYQIAADWAVLCVSRIFPNFLIALLNSTFFSYFYRSTEVDLVESVLGCQRPLKDADLDDDCQVMWRSSHLYHDVVYRDYLQVTETPVRRDICRCILPSSSFSWPNPPSPPTFRPANRPPVQPVPTWITLHCIPKVAKRQSRSINEIIDFGDL
jgi:hypothetical protein